MGTATQDTLGAPITVFDDVDYVAWLHGSQESAAVVVPLLLDAIEPRSVVDVGCGLGDWGAAFSAAGVEEILGIDGSWVEQRHLRIPADRFLVADLRNELELERRFDLAITLEVAHLLEPSAAARFVKTLTALADVVVFSAAIPGQGGLGHLNEQWPVYWSRLFEAEGYVATDPFRATIWEDERVKWWFAQNLVCYVARSALDRHEALLAHLCAAGHPRPLIHPDCYDRYVATKPDRRARSPRLRWRRGR